MWRNSSCIEESASSKYKCDVTHLVRRQLLSKYKLKGESPVRSLCSMASSQIGGKTKQSHWAHFLQRRFQRSQGSNSHHNEEELTDDDELATLRLERVLQVAMVGAPRPRRARPRWHLPPTVFSWSLVLYRVHLDLAPSDFLR